MLINAQELESNTVLKCDICIVGAGPAGITLAKQMEGKGLNVLVVEAGGEGIDKATDDLLLGEVSDPEYPVKSDPYPLGTTRAKGIGGSSLRWCLPGGWRARPMDPIDFEKRDGVPESGWPITYDDLRPYYKRARAFCGLDSEHDDVAFWANAEGEDNLVINDGGVRSEYFFRADNELYSKRKDEFARSESLTLITFANIMEFESTANARLVTAAKGKTLAGNEFTVEAKTFVLAAGGIDNARLLLESNGTAKEGLGNDHDLVGRFFMDHPHIFTGLLELQNRADADRMGFYATLRQRSGDSIEGTLCLSEDLIRQHALPNCSFWVWGVGIKGALKRLAMDTPIARDWLLRRADRVRQGLNLGNLVRDLGHVIDIPVQRWLYRRSQNNLFRLYVESEQIPNPESRVTLSSERDELGARRTKLDWRLQTEDFDTIRRSQELLSQQLQELGIGKLQRMLGDETPRTNLGVGNHQMGTTRMSDAPDKGVVDKDGRVHGVENLYVAGSSVFPTSGAANPTLTIIALTIRMGDTLLGRSS
jgi:choline dehydrogenase-like flavoprotein